MIKPAPNKKCDYVETIGPFEVEIMGKRACVHFFRESFMQKYMKNPNPAKLKKEIQAFISKYHHWEKIAILRPEHLLSEDILTFVERGNFKSVGMDI